MAWLYHAHYGRGIPPLLFNLSTKCDESQKKKSQGILTNREILQAELWQKQIYLQLLRNDISGQM